MDDLKTSLDNKTLIGEFPIPFYNSTVIKKKVVRKEKTKTNEKYNQKNIPLPESSIIISKIYELY